MNKIIHPEIMTELARMYGVLTQRHISSDSIKIMAYKIVWGNALADTLILKQNLGLK